MHEFEQIVVGTKLIPPVSRRRRLVRRKRLASFPASIDRPKLSLVTAPAGYGKTSLLYQWYQDIEAQGHAACWLSLDRQDASPARFLRHVIAALRGKCPGVGEAAMRYLDAARAPDITLPLGGLVNEIIALSHPVVLFLDDYHLIDNNEIDAFLDHLLNLMPANFHLVISSRLVPGLNLPQLRLREELLELDARSLRFDQDETLTFLSQAQARALSPAQIELLHERSEGWIAGLQLAVEALQNLKEVTDITSFVTGNFRDIADYLAKAVLAKQPGDIQTFLLRTAVLDRFNADICEDITGNPKSQDIIENLERANLFVVPLDDQRRWYRFHHLFQEFLLGILRRTSPEIIVPLYLKAAEWSFANGLGSEAVKYALLSGNMKPAAEMAETHALSRIMAGYMPEATRWLATLPRTLRHENPALISLECLSLWHMYQQEEATELLDQLEKLLNQREASLDPDRVICLKNDIRLHRAGINVCGGKNPAETLRHLDEIDIGLLSDFYRGIQHNIRGLALSETNQFDEALVNYRAAARIYRLIETSLGLACSYYLEALMELERGNLQALDRLLASAPEEPVFRKPSARYFYPSMLECIEAILCYERGNPARAFELLEANLTLAVEVGHHKMVSLVQITYARLLQEEGRMEDAEKQLRKLAAHLHRNEPGSSRAMILADYELIRLALANSKIIAAQTLADHYSLPFNGPPPPLSPKWDRLSCLAALAWCRAQLALGEADKALDILRRIARMARQAGRKRRYLECRILEAIALDDLGDDYEAMDVFSSLLAAAAEEGLVRLIADEGERSLSLVRRLKEEGGCVDIDPAFIGRLLKSDPKTGEIMAARENGATLHLDQFSDKEQNLLRLVAMGKSNEEISHRLSITRHTVKWHLGNIFIKLQVKNRTAAVVAAKANRLI